MTWGLFYTPWNLSDPPMVSPLVLLAQTCENGPWWIELEEGNPYQYLAPPPLPPISTGARFAGPSMTLIIQGQGLGPLGDIRSTQTLALGTWAHPHLKLGLGSSIGLAKPERHWPAGPWAQRCSECQRWEGPSKPRGSTHSPVILQIGELMGLI